MVREAGLVLGLQDDHSDGQDLIFLDLERQKVARLTKSTQTLDVECVHGEENLDV